MALTGKKKGIVREIRALHARRERLNIAAVKRSHPELMKRVYAVRPYWGWKRALEDAGLSYTTINTEVRDYVECQICGRNLGSLSYHLVSLHQTTAEEYRQEHPGAELTSETVRAGIAHRKLRKRPVLPHWEAIWTPEYILDRMAELHRWNFPLNWGWAHEHEKALAVEAVIYFGAWDNALRRIGLDPRQIRLFRPTWRGYSPWRTANKAAIIAELRRREKANAALSWKTIVREKYGPALLNRAVKVFGAWSTALIAAGIDPMHGAISPWVDAKKSDIIAEIKRRKRAGISLGYKVTASGKWGEPLIKRAERLFGSWREALLSVGIEPTHGYTHWPQAGKAEVVAEIRRRKRAGKSLRSAHIAKERHGRALQNRVAILFGTWNRALRAAGIEPMKENSPWPKASQAAIIAELRRRHRAGESLATRKVERSKWGNPLINRAKELLGFWAAAVLAAGIDPSPGLMSPWPKADRAEIVAEIRRRKRAGETLRVVDIEDEEWGTPLLNRTRILFGSWNAALIAADIEPVTAMRRGRLRSSRSPRIRSGRQGERNPTKI